MTTGDLVMFRGTGLVPWIIRLWTRSSWGHCGLLVMVEGVPMVLEARHPEGVGLHALVNREEDRPTIYPTGRSVDVPQLLEHSGDHYSVEDAILAGIDRAGHHAGWTCAEFAAYALGLDHEAAGWTPQGLANAVLSR